MGADRTRRPIRAPRPRTRGWLLIAMIALMPAGCDAPTRPADVAAYDPTELTDSLVYRWDRGRSIAVFADTAAQPAGYDLVDAVRAGAAQWNATPRYRDFELVLVGDIRRADVIVRYRAGPERVDLQGCEPSGSGVGRTAFCPDRPVARVLPLLDGGGGRVKVEVEVDPRALSAEFLSGIARRSGPEYLYTLVLHELGHVVGIGGHAFQGSRLPDASVDDVMRAVPLARTPSAGDIRTLRHVLGRTPDIRL